MTSSSNATETHPLLALVADGYIQIDHSWRCNHPDVYGACSCEREAVAAFDARLAAYTERVKAEADWEQLRREKQWPTPNHLRGAATALDKLSIARYGDVLRYVADLCDRRES